MPEDNPKRVGVIVDLVEDGDIRDGDIHTLYAVSNAIGTIPGVHFILTGSYAIEGLVGSLPQHNDMDANVFVTDLHRDLPTVLTLIEEIGGQGGQIHLSERMEERLVFDVVLGTNRALPRRLELQFYKATSVLERTEGHTIDFQIKGEDGKIFTVPTVTVPLRDLKETERLFRVKSLPYALATWAIRISGSALNPKRTIRKTDLDSFGLLLKRPFNHEEVILAMAGHPQMPEKIGTEQVFEQALRRISDK